MLTTNSMHAHFHIAFLETIGGFEILVIAIVILLLFGPRRLPEIARMLGRTSAQFNKAFQDFKDQLMREESPGENPSEDGPNPPDLPEEYADPTPRSNPPTEDRSGPPDQPPGEPPIAG